jgi:CMP-N,N'-diacetyllegionaminic acid synthase
MIRGEPLTAIVPARGGSKGIPRKNLYRIDGETLVERTIRLARESGRVDRVLVTTEDPEIYQVAKALDAAPPSLRPDELARDNSRTIDAVHHLIGDAEIDRGYLLLLQVTSPLRTVADLQALCVRLESNPGADAIASVVRHDAPHPNKIMKIEGPYLKSYLGTPPSVPRQTLPIVYALNGAFYLTSLDVVLKQGTFLPEHTLPFEMPPERSVNLDGPLDLLLLEALLKQRADADPSDRRTGG